MAAPTNDPWYLPTLASPPSGSVAGTNVEATIDTAPPAEPPVTIGTGTKSVWYGASGDGNAWAFTLSDLTFDAVLDVFSTTDGTVLTPVVGTHGIGPVNFMAPTGAILLIRVNGFTPADEGTFTINWAPGSVPPTPYGWSIG